jgi:hypothetical protein
LGARLAAEGGAAAVSEGMRRYFQAIAIGALVLLGAGAVAFFYRNGSILYFGDAEAHLNIARRIFDSRTPGYNQVGTVWLPLLHWLLIPFVRVDALWINGLAGAIPSAVAFVIGGGFLFAAARRFFADDAAACAALALWALNPNVLYLASIPMTESLWSASLMGVLYFTLRFRDTQTLWPAAAAGIAALAGTLTRYEGWFVLPFTALYFLLAAKPRRILPAAIFCAVSGIGPLFVLFHHWWLTGDALAFYRGPYSPRAIQNGVDYPGHHKWGVAAFYFGSAAQICAGAVLAAVAVAGAVVALRRRAFWGLVLLALPGVFIIWAMYATGGTPIYVPVLKPFSYYNSRYGMALLPFFALAAASLIPAAPARARWWAAALMAIACSAPWMLHPTPSSWITWEESRVNSEGRREWTRQVVEYLKPRYVRGSGILTETGDFAGIYRRMGIPLRETFTADNDLPYVATTRRPELFLHEEWIVTQGGGDAQSAAIRAGLRDKQYRLEKTIIVKDSPVIEIYRP